MIIKPLTRSERNSNLDYEDPIIKKFSDWQEKHCYTKL